MHNDWALVVGINNYPHAGVNPLEGAVRDAEAFYEWVTSSEGGAVPPEQVELMTTPVLQDLKGKPRPALWEIMRFFYDLQEQLGNDGGRRLYIYLSGHGISPTGQESVRNAALLMANAKSPKWWHSFPGNIWAEGARSAGVFREVILIMDCCRDIKNNALVIPHIFGDPVIDSTDCRLVEIYATGWGRTARELPLPPDNEMHGVFTHSLLQVLRAGRMNGMLLKDSVRNHLAYILKDQKKAQVPQFGNDEELRMITFNERATPPCTPVKIAGLPASPPVIETWPESATHSQIVPVDDWLYDSGFWQGMLAPGQYELRLPDGRGARLKILAAIPAYFSEEV